MATTKTRAVNISLGVDGHEAYKAALEELAKELGLGGISELNRFLAQRAIANQAQLTAVLKQHKEYYNIPTLPGEGGEGYEN